MAVRVFAAGYEFLDPIALSTTAGSGIILADDGERTAPWVDRPDQQRSDLYQNDALRRGMTTPREVIRAETRPPLPPIPQPFGYRTEELTLDDVVAGNFTPVLRRQPGENMSGSLRNSMTTANPIG